MIREENRTENEEEKKVEKKKDYNINVQHLERLPAEKDVNWSNSRQY